ANDFAHRTPIHVLKRGVWENKGEPVGPRPLSVLVSDDLPELAPDIADPRTRLARWLAAPENPLTARVIVNRLRHHHFAMGRVQDGQGLGDRARAPDPSEVARRAGRHAGRARLAAQADPPPHPPEQHLPAVEPRGARVSRDPARRPRESPARALPAPAARGGG